MIKLLKTNCPKCYKDWEAKYDSVMRSNQRKNAGVVCPECRNTNNLDTLKNKCIITESGCWEWQGSKRNNYASLKQGGKQILVHRLAYKLKNGEISDGLFACHKCNNTVCINPDHIYAGTAKDNYNDMVAAGRNFIPPLNEFNFRKGNIATNRSLTDEVVSKMKAMILQGKKAKEIAATLNIKNQAVRDFKRKRSYFN